MKDIFNKRQRFSIRKLSFGVVSALLGVILFGSSQEVLASTENNLTSSIESSSEIVNSITTVEKKEEVQNNSENQDNVSNLAPKDMSVVAIRTTELREPGDKENNRTVKPTFVSGRDRSSNPETRASAPSSDIKKYELTEEYAKQIKSGEIALEGNKLDSLLLDGPQLNPNGFTDNDYLIDKDEIYIYEKNGKKYVGYNSHPLLEDTDGDGIIDSKEKTDEKLKWNVSERDMIMFMELAYREDNYIDRVLDYKRPLSESELFKKDSDKKPRYEYMMMNKELGPYWKRKKSYHTPSGLDAVLFETKSDFPFLPNGTAQVLAFRGTSDAKDIKADVTLGTGGNPQQGIDAENIISELAKDKSITNLYLTGHSLGGYLVQRAMVEAYQLAYSDSRVMSSKENVAYRNFYNNILKKGTTFNAPKVVTSLVSNREFWQKGLDSKKIAQSGKMTHYIVDNDQTIKKGVSNDSDVVINVGSTSGRHSSRSYFENDMINRRPEFISGKRISLDRTGYQDKNISTIKSIKKVGEKIVYSKNGDDIFKSTTISMKDSDTGKVTENVTNEIFKKDGAKNKVETTEISSFKKYVKDDSREKGQENITVPGKTGSKTTTTTYTVNPETGEVTPNVGKPVIVDPTITVIKVAAKDKVVYSKEGNNIVKETTTYKVDPDNGNITENTTKETFKENGLKDKVDVETIQSPVKYVKDTTREKGQENITIPGKTGSKTTTATYTVNRETGEVTSNVGKPVIVAPTTTVIKVAAKDKVVYSKEGNNIVKETTTYKVDPDNGNITENTTKETFKENGLKDKVDVETIQSPVKYVKDTTREKGQENITVPGKTGSKTTTATYTVNRETGEVTSNVGKPVIVAPTTTVIKVAAKDKVVYSKEGNNIVKETTTYDVNPENGNITENTTKEMFKENGLKDKVDVETIQSPIKYVKDTTREKGQENITVPGKAGSKTTTTTYTVNRETGEVTSNVGKPVIVAPTITVIKVAAKDKVVYSKEGNNIFKETTTYKVDPDNGNITENTTKEMFKENGLKDKVDVETIQSPIKYVKDTTREKGQENITVPGKTGSKTTTTTYTVNRETGEVTSNVGKPVIVAPTITVIKVAAKDKVVYSKEGNNIFKETTTYKVDPDNGNITENTTKETFKENGLKDKIDVETIQSPIKYVKDTTREKGQENITVPGKAGSKTTTTTYTVNRETGEVMSNVGKLVIVAPTITVIKVAAKDKVVYSKEGNNIVKETTTYKVDPDNGNITENTTKETFKENGLKDKIDVETIQSPVKYVKDTTREKGQENITVPGKTGSKTTTTTYTVNRETGEVTSNVGKPVIVAPTTTVIKVAAKDKVEVVQRKNGKKVKVTTVYTVDEKTGNITQTEREEEISREVITSKSDEKVPTIELKPFEGGVNPVESVVTEELKPFEGGVNAETATGKEELPELKLALLKDEEGNILDVLAISEKPKELNGYKYTGKEKEDSEGNKIYIYQKVELENLDNKKQETIVVNQSQNIERQNETIAARKIQAKKLSNTGETPLENGALGGMLLAATMMLVKREVKK